MNRLGAIIRALMFVVCLVPFTSVQQASGALAPFLPVTPAPERNAPAPAGEEDDERETETETEDGKARHSSASRVHSPIRELVGKLPPHASRRVHTVCVRTTPPVAADPFRNGLGTPYRC